MTHRVQVPEWGPLFRSGHDAFDKEFVFHDVERASPTKPLELGSVPARVIVDRVKGEATVTPIGLILRHTAQLVGATTGHAYWSIAASRARLFIALVRGETEVAMRQPDLHVRVRHDPAAATWHVEHVTGPRDTTPQAAEVGAFAMRLAAAVLGVRRIMWHAHNDSGIYPFMDRDTRDHYMIMPDAAAAVDAPLEMRSVDALALPASEPIRPLLTDAERQPPPPLDDTDAKLWHYIVDRVGEQRMYMASHGKTVDDAVALATGGVLLVRWRRTDEDDQRVEWVVGPVVDENGSDEGIRATLNVAAERFGLVYTWAQ